MYEIFIDDVEIIQNFLCVVQYQMCVTVFYSHDIQMHTEVENRCTDPFLQWFKSSIGIDCKCEFVCHIFFIQVQHSTWITCTQYYVCYTFMFHINRMCCLKFWFWIPVWCFDVHAGEFGGKRGNLDFSDHASNSPLEKNISNSSLYFEWWSLNYIYSVQVVFWDLLTFI